MPINLFATEKPEDDPIAHVRHLPIAEQIKYALARYVWPRRHERMPGFDQRTTGKTWEQWFDERNKQSLLDYVEFCKANYKKPTGDRHANRSETGRPVAGPADDATRKRLLKEKLAEKEPKDLYAKKPVPAPKAELPSMTLNPIKNLKQRKSRIDQAIEDSGG